MTSEPMDEEYPYDQNHTCHFDDEGRCECGEQIELTDEEKIALKGWNAFGEMMKDAVITVHHADRCLCCGTARRGIKRLQARIKELEAKLGG